MKRFMVSIGCALAIVLAANVAVAQGKGGGPKAKTTTGGAKSHGPAAKSTHGGGHKSTHSGGQTKTMAPKANGSKSKTTGSAKTAKTTEPKSKATTTNAKNTTTTTSTTPTTTTLTKVQQKLQKNTNLASKLESRLPKGTDLMTAAEGFRNLGQFVAAVNVSKNLGLDFDQLKTAMVDDGMSLGQAIKDQRTSVDSTTEASRAQRDADALIRSTESSTAATTTTPSAKTRKTKAGRP